MLVFTIQPNEPIIIGDPRKPLGRIVCETRSGGRIKVSLDFLPHIEVNRQAVADRIVAETSR